MDMNLLETKINESGYKKEYIASQLNLTRFGLRAKINDPERWRVSEVTKIISLLNLTKAESKQIFDL